MVAIAPWSSPIAWIISRTSLLPCDEAEEKEGKGETKEKASRHIFISAVLQTLTVERPHTAADKERIANKAVSNAEIFSKGQAFQMNGQIYHRMTQSHVEIKYRSVQVSHLGCLTTMYNIHCICWTAKSSILLWTLLTGDKSFPNDIALCVG